MVAAAAAQINEHLAQAVPQIATNACLTLAIFVLGILSFPLQNKWKAKAVIFLLSITL
jgi:hypothetical protein